MRRGLMGWNPDELPKGTLQERIWRLQAGMKREGFDAYLFYTNLVRPSAVTYLTGFTPYWSDGIMLLPRHGEPVFATALSKRVSGWIRTTSPVGEIVNTPKPGVAIGQRLAAARARKVGILELDNFPSGLYDEITGSAPGVWLHDASAPFAAARRGIDIPERDLLRKADALACASLAQVDPSQARDAGSMAGLVEKHARLNGAEEAYIAVAPDLDADRRMIRVTKPVPLANRFAIRASIAYKGSWVRRTRTFTSDTHAARPMFRAEAWFEQSVAQIFAGRLMAAQLAAHLKNLPGAELKNWMAESCVGSYPLEFVGGSNMVEKDTPANGSFLVLSVELTVDGVPWLGAAPAIVGGGLGPTIAAPRESVETRS